MSMYQKNIIYLYVYQDGIKLQNAGFVKLEHMNERYGLYARIKNAGKEQNGEFDVYMKETDGEKKFCVGRMTLQEGTGDFKVVWNANHVEDIEKLWESFEIIEIILDEKTKLLGMNKQILLKADSINGEEEIIRQERLHEETIEKNMVRVQPEYKAEPVWPERDAENQEQIETAEKSDLVEYETDKWKELLRTYPNVHPFGDERCYITLEPKDFPLLTAEYQHLSGNSFLLHGFYNYRHIILGKEDDYFLGVPGTYHEREKMVALMFGFEGFESENKNPRTGTFGYYMRKVKI